VVVGQVVDEEAVHRRAGDRLGGRGRAGGPLGWRRQQAEAHVGELADLGGPAQQQDRRWVVERERERLRQQNSDRADAAGAQAAGDRVGTRVAQLLGGGQDACAHGGGELAGPVVGVGRRRTGDARGGGDVLQRGLWVPESRSC
jgi:hypothetical protein